MITMGTIIPILIKIEIGTLIISYSIKSATAMVLLKIIADNGYKLDIDKVKEYTKNNKNIDGIISFIPIINIISSLFVYYLITNEQVLGSTVPIMENLGLIEEMSAEEKEEYKKNPTGVNALKIIINSSKNKENINDTKESQSQNIIVPEDTEDSQAQNIIVPEEITIEQQPKPKDKTPTAEQIKALRKLREEMIKEARGLTTESVTEDVKEGPQKINRR